MEMSIAQLMEAIESEKKKCVYKESQLRMKNEEIKRLKIDAVNVQARIEEEEEFITNNLLKRLENLKKEKEALAKQVEIEEDFMKNTLKKKLDSLCREKEQLENHLEAEQEYIVHKLQKQLTEVTRQKMVLEKKLNEGHSGLISKLEQSVGEYRDSLQDQTLQREAVSHLEIQVRSMIEQQDKVDNEAEEYRNKCCELEKKLEEMKQDKFLLLAKAHRFREKLQQLQQEREAEFAQSELSQEREFNLNRRSAVLRSRSDSECMGSNKNEELMVRTRSASVTLKKSKQRSPTNPQTSTSGFLSRTSDLLNMKERTKPIN